jgi:WD40 repeat protein
MDTNRELPTRKLVFGSCLVGLTIILVGCGLITIQNTINTWLPIDQGAPNLALSSLFTQDMAALTPESIQDAEEISTIQSSGKPDEIVALHQSMDDMDLLVVHESGLFHRWDMKTQALEAEYDFRIGMRTGVNFNADGGQVVTPGMLVSEDLLYGYSVWDTSTGEVLDCKGDHCPDSLKNYEEGFEDSGLVLSPNGEWVVDYRGWTASGYPTHLNTNSKGRIYVETDSFDDKYYTIDKIAFDRSGVYLAVAIEEGVLKVFDIEYEFLSPADKRTLIEEGEIPGEIISDDTFSSMPKERQYGRYDDENPMHTSDLAIDDTRTWLARLTDEELIIYDLRRMIFPRHMKIPISNGNLLAFNHSGNLLVVATDDEILMFDIAKRKQVASFDTGEATALFFTHDDRLFTWGDADGVIHIWGVEGSAE